MTRELYFERETIVLPQLMDGKPFHAIQPINGANRSEWIVLKSSGNILRVCFDDRSVTIIAQLDAMAFDRAKEVTMRVTDDGRLAAIANRHGSNGIVIDLQTGETTMVFERDDYHIEQSAFPLAFVQRDSSWLLVHGTAWNRLDVSNPITGELLTIRESPKYRTGEDIPRHYDNYFHCGLLVSPDQQWIAENGWAWAPVGSIEVWSIDKWLSENVWESEDGDSKRHLGTSEDWDLPMCWIDNHTLAGWTHDDACEAVVLSLFDVCSGQKIRDFPGPRGKLVVDEFLFSIYPGSEAIDAWDISTGEQVLRDRETSAAFYHRGSKTFWGIGRGSTYVLSRLRTGHERQ